MHFADQSLPRLSVRSIVGTAEGLSTATLRRYSDGSEQASRRIPKPLDDLN